MRQTKKQIVVMTHMLDINSILRATATTAAMLACGTTTTGTTTTTTPWGL